VVRAGETLEVQYRFQDVRFAEKLDSLSARGLWPPRVDSELYRRIEQAGRVHVFRLDPVRWVFPAPTNDSARFVGPWPIVREGPRPAAAWRRLVLETLAHPELYEAKLLGAVKPCAGGFRPGVAARFVGDSVTTELAICYHCGEFSMRSSDGLRQAGDFVGEGAAFVRLAREIFPDDSVLRSLEPRR
jgi:hypothetical protein